jgi:hypothetical protein
MQLQSAETHLQSVQAIRYLPREAAICHAYVSLGPGPHH